MRWTLRSARESCGNCGRDIAAGEPLAVLTLKNLIRCDGCAGEPVDVDAIAAARRALDEQAAHVATLRESYTRTVPPAGPDVLDALKAARKHRRHEPPAIDRKRSSAGDDD